MSWTCRELDLGVFARFRIPSGSLPRTACTRTLQHIAGRSAASAPAVEVSSFEAFQHDGVSGNELLRASVSWSGGNQGGALGLVAAKGSLESMGARGVLTAFLEWLPRNDRAAWRATVRPGTIASSLRIAGIPPPGYCQTAFG